MRKLSKKDVMMAERLEDIYRRLFAVYGEQHCTLHYTAPHELLVATIMSAQCTDKRVNAVTADLFVKYPDIKAFAAAAPVIMAEDIRSVGLFRHKAESIVGACRAIVERYNGQVPDDIDSLVELPGIGRKTANVVLGDAFKVPGFPVDTHVNRVLNRLKVVDTDVPEKIESRINALVAPEYWVNFSHLLILHGRETCTARSPLCGKCELSDICEYRMKE